MNRRTLGVVFTTAWALAACGGGDAGPSPSPAQPPTPSPTTPLALNTSNAASIAGLAPGAGDAVLSVAQFAVDSVRRFALPGTVSPLVETCPNGGLITVTLTDRDADGVASAGDRVSVLARDCAVPVVTDVVNGTMEIELGTPTGPAAAGQRGAVALGSGLRFGTTSPSAISLLGSMVVEWSATDLQTSVHVLAAPGDDLRIAIATSASTSVMESIRQPDLSKTLKYDEARSVVSMAYRYESQALFGSIVVSTPDPLRAYLGTYPEAGRIEVTGAAGSKLVLTPNFANSSNQFQFTLDANGDGSTDFTSSVVWTDSAPGYLWWDGTTQLNWPAPVFYTRPFATTDFFAALNFKWTTASTTAFRLQFNRPLASTTPPLHARFVDQGSYPYDGTPFANVGTNVEAHGALVIVRPTEPLRHARTYQLQFSLDGSDWSNALTVQDALGNSTAIYASTGLSIVTPDNLRAVASADTTVLLSASDRLHLVGSASTSTARAIVSYHWSQRSGTPLAFDTPDAAQTQVFWGATPPSGAEEAVLQLTVTDSAGDTDTTLLTIQSANLSGASHVLYYRSASGDYIGRGLTAVYAGDAARFEDTLLNPGYSRSFIWTNGDTTLWLLDLATADGSPFTVGTYENAIRAPFHGAQNGIDFSGNGNGCNSTYGRFDVLEVQTDAAGNFTRLAVDFEQHCESAGAPPLLGSYRINSSVPIRR